MPTARELLEQADALMRRNRALAAAQDDIPELTDEVPIAARGDVVPVGARPARSLFAFQAAAPADRDDVPELIDAVEEIEAVALEAMPDEGGEDSRWLETNLGEASITGPAPDSIAVVPRATPPTQRDDDADAPRGPSADAGDSAAGVEPAAPAPPSISGAATLAANANGEIAAPLAAGAPTRDPVFEAMLGMADAPMRATPAEEEFTDDLHRMRVVVPGEAAATLEPETAFDKEPDRMQTAESGEAAAASETETAFGDELNQTRAVVPDEAAATAETGTAFHDELNRTPAVVPDEAAATAETETAFDEELNRTQAVVPGEAAATRASVPSQETPPPMPAGASSAHALAGDAARWVSLAEDVRMQVLQRIDIFTDTGLQEQLTARLQPIVDRASADLVATINQHVGQLLRAYVAEAIEREIEKWRQGDR